MLSQMVSEKWQVAEHTTGVFVREIAGREYPVPTVYVVDNRMWRLIFLHKE